MQRLQCPLLERLYTIAPSFGAEKSRTRRHLTEFWHAEMEIAWADNDDVMAHEEALVRHIAKTLLLERSDELVALGRDLEVIKRYAESDYPRIRYDEAIERLQSKGWTSSGDRISTTARRRCSLLTSTCPTS